MVGTQTVRAFARPVGFCPSYDFLDPPHCGVRHAFARTKTPNPAIERISDLIELM
jgi:hypothetical protein